MAFNNQGGSSSQAFTSSSFPNYGSPSNVDHRATNPQFDILEWYPQFQSCHRYFLDVAQHTGPVQALAAFYQAWQHEELVVDKWFMLQATSALPGTLDQCRALLGHPAFALKNPNRARSVISSFASANPLHFHERSGAGYAFLADQVIALDPINPSMAARFVQPLGTWRRQDPARQALMKQALDRVLAVEGLSKGTYEMASKSLA